MSVTGWRSITDDPPPKDRWLLLYGKPDDTNQLSFHKPGVHAGYYDPVDRGWCISASTWEGPFITPTHWMPLPPPPEAKP